MATSFAPDRSTPGPTTWLPGGAYWAFRKDPLTFFTRTARIYGDIAAFSFGPQKVYLITRPEWIEDVLVKSASKFSKGVALQRAKRLIGEGLLTSEGAAHLRQRRTIQPLFHRQQVQGFADAMVRHAVRWRDSLNDNAPFDMASQMGALTLAIVGETLFSSNVEGDTDEVRDALGSAVQSFAYAFVPFFDVIEKLPLPVFKRVRIARERLDRIIHRVIAERRRAELGGDLISMLLAARDPENPGAPGMSDEQIRDEALTIFLAGHETTANAMAWTWHLLAAAPEAEQRLHEEIDRVLGSVPSVLDVPRLEFTRAVVAESMRLYPPAWTMGRRVIEPHTIDGHHLERGALVITPQWVVHRDTRWWDAPDSFRPERWLAAPAESKAARPKYAYFPFGGGVRICIGESFAWTEAILLLATIAQRWQFRHVSGTRVAPEPRITLRPNGLLMRAHARG